MASSTASDSAGQASSAHGPNSRSVSDREREAGVRVDPQERARSTEMAERRRAVPLARPVRRSCRRAARTRGPSRADRTRPTPGSTPFSPGKATVVAVREQRPGDERRPQELGGEPDEVVERPVEALRRPLQERESRHPERGRGPTLAGPSSNGAPARSATSAPEHVEARVRVDPPPAGRRDRLASLERQPRGVGQQVPHRRARRSGRLVELDQAAIDRDQHGQRRRRAW